jgi:hypothetical protein
LAHVRDDIEVIEMSSGTLADQLLEVLLEAGVQRIYGVVGDS